MSTAQLPGGERDTAPTLVLPPTNFEYNKQMYWDDRYEKDDSYEWFKGYESFRHLVAQYVRKTDRILMLGCGNSPLSADMYNEGYHGITNIDYSRTCIEKMASKYAAMTHMSWIEMDARELRFDSGSVDVVLEKGTLDAIMSAEKSPWTVSEATRQYNDRILTEISRVLSNGGRFVSITFAQPHFRSPVYAQAKYGWSLQSDKFGIEGTFHYFWYVMTKGGELTPEQLAAAQRFFDPPSPDIVVDSDDSDEVNSESFLQRIEL